MSASQVWTELDEYEFLLSSSWKFCPNCVYIESNLQFGNSVLKIETRNEEVEIMSQKRSKGKTQLTYNLVICSERMLTSLFRLVDAMSLHLL